MTHRTREEIIGHAKDFVRRNLNTKFIPGQTYITSTGQYMDEEEIANLMDVAFDMRFCEGKWAKQFEKDLVAFYKFTIRNAILTNSGSSANLLAITTITDKVFGSRRASPRDEIITVAAGFPTTIAPIIQNGLIPVFLDVDLETFHPDFDVLEQAIVEGKTKGVILAHPLGNPYDAGLLREICDQYGIWMIEDNCDCLGGSVHGDLTGSQGDISTLSFYPAHHITAGEGGACLTSSPMVKKILDSYANWGKDCWCEPGVDNTCGKRFGWELGELPMGYDHKYTFSRIGYNLKCTDMGAALLVAQLKKLPMFVDKRVYNWNRLYDGLKKYKKYFRFMKAIPGAKPSWFGFSITVKETSPFTSSQLATFLESKRIGTRRFFAGNILRQPGYQHIPHRVIGNLANSDVLSRDCIWIGVHPSITDEMIDYTLSVFDGYMEGK